MRKPIESQAMLLVFLFFYYQCPKTTYKSNDRHCYHHHLLFPAIGKNIFSIMAYARNNVFIIIIPLENELKIRNRIIPAFPK